MAEFGDPIGKLFPDEKDPYGTLNPEQEALSRDLGPTLRSRVLAGPQPYSGRLTETITPEEIQALNRARSVYGGSLDTINRLTNLQDDNFNTQFRQEIVDPTLRTFRQDIQPMLEESLPTFSTARGEVLRRAVGDLQGNLLQQRFSARESARDRALRAVGLAPQTAQADVAAASVPRELKQAGLDRAYMDYIQSNQQYSNDINQALQFMGISTGTVTPNRTLDYIMAALSAAAGAAGATGGGGSTGGAPSGVARYSA